MCVYRLTHICVYIYMCVWHPWAFMCECMYMNTHYRYICMVHACMYAYNLCESVHLAMHIARHVNVCWCMYAYQCVCIYACMYECRHIYVTGLEIRIQNWWDCLCVAVRDGRVGMPTDVQAGQHGYCTCARFSHLKREADDHDIIRWCHCHCNNLKGWGLYKGSMHEPQGCHLGFWLQCIW